MSQKKKRRTPVPPANQSKAGPNSGAIDLNEQAKQASKQEGAPFEELDPKRRLGDYETRGEHAIQQPGGKNDADH